MAWILLSVGLGAFVLAILGAALLIGTGSDSDAESNEALALIEESLELPLAEDEQVLMLAQRKKTVLVGLAARTGGPVEVVAVKGEAPAGSISFALDGEPVEATPCGQACSHLAIRVLAGRSRTLTVQADGERFDFGLSQAPPASGATLFARVTNVMERLRSYRYEESLTSGVGEGVKSSFEVVPPDRLRLRTADGFGSVIIRRSRWDRQGGRWKRTAFPGLRVTYMWDGAGNARLLGQGHVRGKPVAILSVYDRAPVPAWFLLYVTRDRRVLRADMLAPSHFMRQDFSAFNAPLSITPPLNIRPPA